MSSTRNSVESVVSMATDLEIRNVLKIKMKTKKNIRKQKSLTMKTENWMRCATTAAKKGIRVRPVGSGSMAVIKNSRKQKKPLTVMRMMWFYAVNNRK